MSVVNNLKVTRLTLGEWLSEDADFTIPHYQRKYCWTRENCESLFHDLVEVAEQSRATHFCGTITLSPVEDRRFYVVDGQQRLTTLWLFAHLLRRVMGGQNADLPESDCLSKRLTFEDPHDQKTWRHLLLGRFCDEEGLNREMAENASWLEGEIEARADILRLAHMEHRLLERFLLVRVVLPASLAPQRIFERMNGVKLEITPMDLIKNFLLMECRPGEEAQEVYQAWEIEFWNLQWMFKILVEALVCADVHGTDLYRRFRQLFETGGFGPELRRVPALLAQCRVWFEAFRAANAIFETLTGGYELPKRYPTLVMRTTMVFRRDQANASRRNKVLADVAEHILGWIASDRLRVNRLHKGDWGSAKCHECLRAFNVGVLTAVRFEAAILQHFPPIAREDWERGFRSWIQHEKPRPARNWGILGLGDDAAELNATEMAASLEMRFKERRHAVGE